MTQLDLITMMSLMYFLLAAVVGLILYLRSKSRARVLPRIAAVAGGLSMLASLVTGSLMRRSISGLVGDILFDLAISIGFGLAAGYSGRVLTRRIWKDR